MTRVYPTSMRIHDVAELGERIRTAIEHDPCERAIQVLNHAIHSESVEINA